MPDIRSGTCRFWRPVSPATFTAGVQQGRCLAIQRQPFWVQHIFPVTLASEGVYCAEWRGTHVQHAA